MFLEWVNYYRKGSYSKDIHGSPSVISYKYRISEHEKLSFSSTLDRLWFTWFDTNLVQNIFEESLDSYLYAKDGFLFQIIF